MAMALPVVKGESNTLTLDREKHEMGLDTTKPVFGVFDNARLKPVSSATETGWNSDISLIASFNMCFPISYRSSLIWVHTVCFYT